jgi:hypothetical protein
MRAAVRHFISPDVDLENFHPDDPENFSFLLQAIVGPVDSEGDESLQMIVCTPAYLRSRLDTETVIFGRPYVIVGSPGLSRILGSIKASIERIDGRDWGEVAKKLARLGIWEFEDFQ